MDRLIKTFPWGYIATFGDNEIEIVSTISDPPKIRVAVDEGKVESNLGCFSFNTRRPDGNHDELGYIMGRLTADKQEAALYAALRPRGEQDCREVFYIDPSIALFHVPVVAPNISGSGQVTRFYTDGGMFCVNMQDDPIGGERQVRAVKYLIVPTPEHPDIVTEHEVTWVAVGEAIL